MMLHVNWERSKGITMSGALWKLLGLEWKDENNQVIQIAEFSDITEAPGVGTRAVANAGMCLRTFRFKHPFTITFRWPIAEDGDEVIIRIFNAQGYELRTTQRSKFPDIKWRVQTALRIFCWKRGIHLIAYRAIKERSAIGVRQGFLPFKRH